LNFFRTSFWLVVIFGITGCLSFSPGTPAGAPKDATFLRVADTTVRYLDVGQGPAVVLLHGFASSMDNWNAVIPELKNNHRVIALDLKGFGYTSRPAGDYSPQAQARLVLELLKERGVESFSLVGHSWGSSVALQIALMAPEKVDRIALYDAWVYAEQLPTFFWWSRASGVGETLFALFYNERPADKISSAFYDPTIIDQRFVEAVEESLSRPGTRAAALEAVRGQRYEEWQEDYKKIEQPTLLLWGREDAVTLLKFGERLERELPNAELVVYPRCGHFPMKEAQTASTKRLVEFLAPTIADGGAL
jgi:pimeloyl-ACP methyl ester carboxylesterase